MQRAERLSLSVEALVVARQKDHEQYEGKGAHARDFRGLRP
jgi:hypothetical protein